MFACKGKINNEIISICMHFRMCGSRLRIIHLCVIYRCSGLSWSRPGILCSV